MDDLDKLLLAAAGSGDFEPSRYDEATLTSLVSAVPGPMTAEVFLFLCRWLDVPEVASAAAQLMAEASDPAAIAETLDLLDQVSLPARVKRQAWSTFMHRAGSKTEHPAIRSQSLRGALCMAQADPPLLRQLQAFLLLAEPDDDATFLRHVAKVLGVVLRHYQDQDLKASLEALVEVEGAGDEASMELGLFSMEVGLVALDRHTADASFRSALGWFRRSMQQSEERPDAKLYGLCAEVLVTVQEKGLHHDVSGFVDRLRHAAFEYSAYLMPEHPVFTGSWLEFSSLERFQWLSLCTKLGALSLSLAREEYLHAASVIEDELLPIFKAGHRIFDRDDASGIESVAVPAVLNGLQKQRTYLHALDQWITENQGSSVLPDAAAMRAAVRDAYEKSVLHVPFEVAIDRQVADILKAGGVNDATSEMLTSQLMIGIDQNPRLPPLWKTIIDQFADHPDCLPRSPARAVLQAVTNNLLSFLVYRANTGKQTDPGGAYLFRGAPEPPQEAHIQLDYLKFVIAGNIPHVKAEQRNHGGGRSDIAISYRGVETVIETKKDASVPDLSALARRYAGQASAYQRTNVRFAFLLVLDLTDRKGDQPDIEEQICVSRIVPPGSEREYSVVVARVQGNRLTPHSL